MTEKRTKVGRGVEDALGEGLAHVRGEVDLACRLVDDPNAAVVTIDAMGCRSKGPR